MTPTNLLRPSSPSLPITVMRRLGRLFFLSCFLSSWCDFRRKGFDHHSDLRPTANETDVRLAALIWSAWDMGTCHPGNLNCNAGKTWWPSGHRPKTPKTDVGVSKRQRNNAINFKEVSVCAWLSDHVTSLTRGTNELPVTIQQLSGYIPELKLKT